MNEGELEIMTGLCHLSEFFARNCDGNSKFQASTKPVYHLENGRK